MTKKSVYQAGSDAIVEGGPVQSALGAMADTTCRSSCWYVTSQQQLTHAQQQQHARTVAEAWSAVSITSKVLVVWRAFQRSAPSSSPSSKGAGKNPMPISRGRCRAVPPGSTVVSQWYASATSNTGIVWLQRIGHFYRTVQQ